MEFPPKILQIFHAQNTHNTYLKMGSLFPICNAYHLGAYQVAINEAADLDSTGTAALSSSDAIEKDCYVYRSYIALGSYQVRLKLCFLSLRERLSTSDEKKECSLVLFFFLCEAVVTV